MDLLVVGTGRCGTVSLAQWLNDLFQLNKLPIQAAHEYLARECYLALDEYYKTRNEIVLKTISEQCCYSHFYAIVGNGYASLLPYFAKIDKNIILIHLQRRDREGWITSSARNAKYYPAAYQYYVPDEAIKHKDIVIPRTTAFHVGEATEKEWSSWSLEKKLAWHYDYMHTQIANYSTLFAKTHHVYTEDLNDLDTLTAITHFCFPEVTKIPPIPKLNSHHFANIENFPPAYRSFAQWLLGNIDWQQVAADPSYLVTYAMNRFETWIGWCQTGRAQDISPVHALTQEQMDNLLKVVLPKFKETMALLEKVPTPAFD